MLKTFVLPKQTMPYIAGRKLHAMKMRDGFEDKSWADYFVYLANKDDITIKPTMGTMIQYGTEKALLAIWMDSFAENLPYIRHGDFANLTSEDKMEGHTISELAAPEVKDEPSHSAIIVGRGPSIFTHKHLEVLASAKQKGEYKGLIVATDGMLIECLKHGIVPDLTVSVDGSPIIKQWYDGALVKEYGSQLKVALTCTINNEVYKTCVRNGCHVYWYLPMMDSYFCDESATKVMRYLTKTPNNPDGLVMVILGGNAGAASWVFASTILKASPCCLIGMDFGYPEGTKLVDTPYYSSMVTAKSQISSSYQQVYHPYFKTRAQIDAVFTHYKEAFLGLQANNPAWYEKAGGTINASEGGCLWGQRVKCTTFKEFLGKYKR